MRKINDGDGHAGGTEDSEDTNVLQHVASEERAKGRSICLNDMTSSTPLMSDLPPDTHHTHHIDSFEMPVVYLS